MDLVVDRFCGFRLHKDSVVACVRTLPGSDSFLQGVEARRR